MNSTTLLTVALVVGGIVIIILSLILICLLLKKLRLKCDSSPLILDVESEVTERGYVGGYEGAVGGYDGAVRGYDGPVGGYDGAVRGYEGPVGGYERQNGMDSVLDSLRSSQTTGSESYYSADDFENDGAGIGVYRTASLDAYFEEPNGFGFVNPILKPSSLFPKACKETENNIDGQLTTKTKPDHASSQGCYSNASFLDETSPNSSMSKGKKPGPNLHFGTKNRKRYSGNSLRRIGWAHAQKTRGIRPQDTLSSRIWAPPSPPQRPKSAPKAPPPRLPPPLQRSTKANKPPPLLPIPYPQLRIVVDATPRWIGGYCIDGFRQRIEYYSVASRRMPWTLMNQTAKGNSTEFEMKNLFCALLLWQPLILRYKSVEIFTDNAAIYGRNQYGRRIQAFISHLKNCQGVEIVNPKTMCLNRSWPVDFEDVIGPADALSRRGEDQFVGNVPGFQHFSYQSIIFGKVKPKVQHWTKYPCSQCDFTIESTGSFRRN